MDFIVRIRIGQTGQVSLLVSEFSATIMNLLSCNKTSTDLHGPALIDILAILNRFGT